MKTRMTALIVLVAIIVGTVAAPVFATSDSYDIIVPKTGSAWSSEYMLDFNKYFKTKLAASGGKNIVMVVCRADTLTELGSRKTVSPGTTTYDLWKNATFSRTVRVKLTTPTILVNVRAQGTWYYNV